MKVLGCACETFAKQFCNAEMLSRADQHNIISYSSLFVFVRENALPVTISSPRILPGFGSLSLQRILPEFSEIESVFATPTTFSRSMMRILQLFESATYALVPDGCRRMPQGVRSLAFGESWLPCDPNIPDTVETWILSNKIEAVHSDSPSHTRRTA